MLPVFLSPGNRARMRCAAVLLALLFAPAVFAQAQTQDATLGQTDPNSPEVILPAVTAVPIISAGMADNTFFQGGTPNLHPLVSPVILIPFGQNWLIESRDTFEINLAPVPGQDGYKGYLQKEVDYLQLDYIANPYLTIT